MILPAHWRSPSSLVDDSRLRWVWVWSLADTCPPSTMFLISVLWLNVRSLQMYIRTPPPVHDMSWQTMMYLVISTSALDTLSSSQDSVMLLAATIVLWATSTGADQGPCCNSTWLNSKIIHTDRYWTTFAHAKGQGYFPPDGLQLIDHCRRIHYVIMVGLWILFTVQNVGKVTRFDNCRVIGRWSCWRKIINLQCSYQLLNLHTIFYKQTDLCSMPSPVFWTLLTTVTHVL